MNKKNARFTMPSAILMGGMAILAGCMNGVYTIDSSIDCDDEIESMPYELVNDKADPFKEVLFKEDTMPVVVNEVSHGDTVDSSNLTVFLWGLTLGVFPAFESHTETYDLSVLTPIGKKSKSYSTTKRSWMGWIPIVVPVPGWGVSRWYFRPESKNAEEQRDRTLRQIREKTIKSIVGEFSSSEYQHFAKNTNDVRAKELDRIKNVKAKIDGHVAKNEFDEAEELRVNEAGERPGTWACDKDTWNSIKQEIVNKKEDYRVANKKTELEKLFGESKFEDVVAECEKESGGEERHVSVWAELRAKAETAISERDRKIELARISAKKLVVEKLLAEKRYAEVISQCDEEKDNHPGSRFEDAEIWQALRNQAASAKANIDRKAEEERIAKKVKEVEELLANKRYTDVITLCDAEKGQNPGSQATDLEQWKQYRTKAVCARLLVNANERSKSTFCLKGFYLGMAVSDAKILLAYYFPNASITEKENYVDVDVAKKSVHKMHFCETEHGQVVRLNFDAKMLRKFYDYDVQTYAEWAQEFVNNHDNVRFVARHVQDKKEIQSAWVSVSQQVYFYKSNQQGYSLSYFGEKDVTDFSNLMDTSSSDMSNPFAAFALGMKLGMKQALKEWPNDGWENAAGAREGTLRVEVLKEEE